MDLSTDMWVAVIVFFVALVGAVVCALMARSKDDNKMLKSAMSICIVLALAAACYAVIVGIMIDADTVVSTS